MPGEKKVLTPQQAKLRLMKYCAYQERSHKECKTKLNDLGVFGSDADDILLYLVQNNFLNEERFAHHFAQSKLKVKKWGKEKIIYQLRLKGINEKLIKNVIQELPENNYEQNLTLLIQKKYDRLQKQNISELEIKKKIFTFLLSKGYKYSEITPAFQSIFP